MAVMKEIVDKIRPLEQELGRLERRVDRSKREYRKNVQKEIRIVKANIGEIETEAHDASRWGRLYDFHKRLKDFPMPPLLGPGDPRPETKDEHMWMYNKGELTGALQDAGSRIVKLTYSPGVRGRHFNIWAVRK